MCSTKSSIWSEVKYIFILISFEFKEQTYYERTVLSFVEHAKLIFGYRFTSLQYPVFEGNNRQHLVDCIDSNFLSSVGSKITEFEEKVAEFKGSTYEVASINGTAAFHVAVELAGVKL